MLRVDEDAGVGVLEVDVSDGDGIVGKSTLDEEEGDRLQIASKKL